MVLATISWFCFFKVEAQLVWNFSPDRLEPCASPALTAAEDRKLQAAICRALSYWNTRQGSCSFPAFSWLCPTSLLCHPFTECCLCKQKLDSEYCKSTEKGGKALISWRHRGFQPQAAYEKQEFCALKGWLQSKDEEGILGFPNAVLPFITLPAEASIHPQHKAGCMQTESISFATSV